MIKKAIREKKLMKFVKNEQNQKKLYVVHSVQWVSEFQVYMYF